MAYDAAFRYDWTRGGLNLLGSTTQQYEDHMFPLSVIGRGGWELPNWVQGYEAYWRNKAATAQESGDASDAETALRCADDAKAFGEHLKGITEQYQVAYIELDRELAINKVCDIFTQVNSKGIRLDVFDLINALLKPKGMQLKHMWRNAAPLLDFVETERMNVYILQVMSILRQAYCSPKYLYYLLPQQEKLVRDPDGSLHKEVLVKDTAQFETLWDSAVEALRKAINLLRHPQEQSRSTCRNSRPLRGCAAISRDGPSPGHLGSGGWSGPLPARCRWPGSWAGCMPSWTSCGPSCASTASTRATIPHGRSPDSAALIRAARAHVARRAPRGSLNGSARALTPGRLTA